MLGILSLFAASVNAWWGNSYYGPWGGGPWYGGYPYYGGYGYPYGGWGYPYGGYGYPYGGWGAPAVVAPQAPASKEK